MGVLEAPGSFYRRAHVLYEYCFEKTTLQIFPNFNPSFKLLQHGEVDK